MKRLFSAITMAALSATTVNASPLSGTYTLQGSQNCVNFLNGEAGVSFGEFNVGDTLTVVARPNSLEIKDAQTGGEIGYAVGRFDETGPVSDGTVFLVNQYQNHETMFSTGYEGSTASNFGQYVYAVAGKNVQVYERDATGNDLFCTFVGQ